MSKKKMFEVGENETIEGCLERMNDEGFRPVRRMEKPVFKEEKVKGKSEIVPAGQKIVFEGKKTD